MSWDGRVEGRGSKEGGVGWSHFFSYDFVLLGVIYAVFIHEHCVLYDRWVWSFE